MCKDMVISGLSEAREGLRKELELVGRKDILMILQGLEVKNATKKIKYRLNTLEIMIRFINKTEFIEDTKGLEEVVSEYNTLFDRTTMFYDSSKLEGMSNIEVAQIMLCEIFNSMQRPRKAISKKTIEFIEGLTLLMMYSCGITNERLGYGIKYRSELLKTKLKRYPESSTIHFTPKKEKLELINEIYKKESDGVFWNIKETGLKTEHEEDWNGKIRVVAFDSEIA